MTNPVSKRYSKALFMVTKSKENTQKILGELETVYAATHRDHELRSFFDDPLTETSAKVSALKKATANFTLSSETQEFVHVLIKNKRFGHLGTIISDVHGLVDQENGVQRGTIRAAQPLDIDTIRKIEGEFEGVLKSKVQLVYKQDPELLGGVVAEVAGFTFDDSLSNHLTKLSDNLIRH